MSLPRLFRFIKLQGGIPEAQVKSKDRASLCLRKSVQVTSRRVDECSSGEDL